MSNRSGLSGGDSVNFHRVRFVYPVEIVGGNERVEVDGSSDAFGWFSRDEIAGLDRVGLLDEALP